MPDQPTPALLAAARAYAEATWGYDAPYWTPRDRENHIDADALSTAEQPWFAALWEAGLAEGRRQATEGPITLSVAADLTDDEAAELKARFQQAMQRPAVMTVLPESVEIRQREWAVRYPDGYVYDDVTEAAARDIAARYPHRVVVSRLVGPWEPAEQREEDPWRLAEWAALPDECFIDGCSGSDIDQRGPVFIRGGLIRKACVEHWEPIFRVLGEQAAWERTDAMASGPAEPASGGVVEPSGPLTAEEATPDCVVPARGDHDRVTVKAIQRALAGLKAGGPIVLGDAIPALPETLTVHLDNRNARFVPADPPVPYFDGDEALPHPPRRQHDPGALIEEPDFYGDPFAAQRLVDAEDLGDRLGEGDDRG